MVKATNSEEDQNSRPTFLKSVKVHFKEYCSHTSVHGCQYIGEEGRATAERIWWFIIFVLCLTGCVISIHAVYKKWESSPVIVNFANRGTPINRIPFPAVTICPESQVGQSTFNYTKILEKIKENATLNDTEEKALDYMNLLCDYVPDYKPSENDTFSEEFFEFMILNAPDTELRNCTFSFFNESTFSCHDLFTDIIIDEGVCYSFNILDKSETYRDSVVHPNNNYHTAPKTLDWSLESSYVPNASKFAYPRRTLSGEVTRGLTFTIITPKNDVDYACKGPAHGYRVLVHAPIDVPRIRQQYFRLPLDQSVVAEINPILMTTSPGIKKYSAAKRGCYFEEERYLQHFRIYTFNNCRIECLTNVTLEHCDCVGFFMPRVNGTKICGTAKKGCMEWVDRKFIYLNKKCDCLPRCSALSYDVHTSQADLNWNKWVHSRTRASYIGDSYVSSLTLYFKANDFVTSERNELYGPLDFLANFGGLLGLFTGFSILSLMEIIYFLTVRICCNMHLYKKWAGPNILIKK